MKEMKVEITNGILTIEDKWHDIIELNEEEMKEIYNILDKIYGKKYNEFLNTYHRPASVCGRMDLIEGKI